MVTRRTRLAAALLRNSIQAGALIGAGFSTPSGGPDFRSGRSGVWRQVDPLVAKEAKYDQSLSRS